jgi:hypothetical protein
VDLLPENQEASDLWFRIKNLGADLVWRIMDLKLTQVEAEDLLAKFEQIESIISELNQPREGA